METYVAHTARALALADEFRRGAAFVEDVAADVDLALSQSELTSDGRARTLDLAADLRRSARFVRTHAEALAELRITVERPAGARSRNREPIVELAP